jgi:lycopene beta-cyclase
VAVVGTGVSALLAARALTSVDRVDEIRVFGPARKQAPHLLSYWSDGPTPFDAYAEWSWSRLRVGDPPFDVPLDRFQYRTFRAQRWADGLRRDLEADPRVSFVEAKVDGVDEGGVVVGTDRWEADWVLDSRRGPERPAAVQQFVGWEIEHDGVIETDAATLLDFRTPAGNDFRFAYLLPLAPGHLFVEHVSYAPCDHDRKIVDYLSSVLGLRSWRLVDRESGATPILRAPLQRRRGKVVRIGVGGGVAKIATGYALLRMWRDAEAIARRIAATGRPPRIQRGGSPLFRVADRYFLDLLETAPERLPELLTDLFSRAPGDAVLAFLDDRASLLQQAAIAAAVPGWVRWSLATPLRVAVSGMFGAPKRVPARRTR